ncbi:hypothetical protein Ocin01_10324 [Orchesella cincta]|uniref:Uncharacterized protein n=1 Tax=Orchesella cincta TaxID=48709 RepID=A0A1D2MTY2_ORCCI|nr:hypothetical protein Ocin01_10324 [Orchesella cincta]
MNLRDKLCRRRKTLIVLTFLLLNLYMAMVDVYFVKDENSWWLSIKSGNGNASSWWSSAASRFQNAINKVVEPNPHQGDVEAEQIPDPLFLPSSNTGFPCPIPKLDPFHHSIESLVFEGPRSFNCEERYPILFNSTLNSTVIPLKSVEEAEKLGIKSCCYKTIQRPAGSTNDSEIEYSDTCHPISLTNATAIPPEHEFLAIHCEPGLHFRIGNMTVLSTLVDVHAFVHLKPNVEERIKKTEERQLEPNKENVNVLILGLDSVSRMNFIRSMPHSHSFLVNNLSAVEMLGYNIVGYNTFQNVVAALTSLNEKEINSSCQNQLAFDNCPFIWKNFSQRGYTTSFGEDMPTWGIFNYEMAGFKKPPTDYYLRPFGHLGEIMVDSKNVCNGPRLAWHVLLDYIQKFAYTMGKDKRYFQFIWSTALTHNGLNDGQLGDKAFVSTLKWFQQEEHLNQTVLIVASDHGARFGPIVQLQQGPVEQRLPFLYFVVPPWFKKKYEQAYENLKANQDKLTTPYDLYETLADLLSLERITRLEIQQRERDLEQFSTRGISQFLPISQNRTCEMAGIEDHYCVCRNLKEVSTNNSDVKEAARYAVHFINLILVDFPQCSFLSLANITSATVGIDWTYQIKQFLIFFETLPNNASFEATVVQRRKGSWSVSGTIDRTNLYGNQSHCVNSREAKLYCYCIDLDPESSSEKPLRLINAVI